MFQCALRQHPDEILISEYILQHFQRKHVRRHRKLSPVLGNGVHFLLHKGCHINAGGGRFRVSSSIQLCSGLPCKLCSFTASGKIRWLAGGKNQTGDTFRRDHMGVAGESGCQTVLAKKSALRQS